MSAYRMSKMWVLLSSRNRGSGHIRVVPSPGTKIQRRTGNDHDVSGNTDKPLNGVSIPRSKDTNG